MADKKERRGLGRGLSALMADVAPATQVTDDAPGQRSANRGETRIPIDRIKPNPDQPRRAFSSDALDELAESIRERGVIQPLILRPDPAERNHYQIVAGERRWRAAQRAQLHQVPAIVRELTDIEVLEIAIIENIQREDLNPVEEAQGYRQLMERFGHTQEKVAEALGKSRSHIANMMRLLGLPEEVLALLSDGRLSAGHARALITALDPVGLAQEVVRKGLSVRQTEKLAKAQKPLKPVPEPRPLDKDADTRLLEQDLMAVLRMKVSIRHNDGREDGVLSISYKTLDELDDLCRRITATSAGN